MAVKWIWGFEAGADETFYSGSGWSINRFVVSPTGAGNFGLGGTSKTNNLYDYKNNFPHQPPSLVGGGQYSLKVSPPSWLSTGEDYVEVANNRRWESTSPMSIMSPLLGATDTATISFSMYCDLDQTQFPLSGGSCAFAQRFFSLYPQQTTTEPLHVPGIPGTQISFYGTPLTASGDVPNNMPTLPPQLSLFMAMTASAGVRENRIIAVCTTGTINYDSADLWPGFNLIASGAFERNNSVPQNTRYAGLWAMGQPMATLASGLFQDGTSGPVTDTGFFAYTSSAGDYIQGGKWTEVTVEFTPDKTAGAIRVYLDGVSVINVEGVPTAYTSSYDWDTGLIVSENLTNTGRIEFPTTGFYAFPGPNSGFAGISSSIEPATFIYDHVVMFDEAADLSTATSSIFIQGTLPRTDQITGSYVGDDDGTGDLFDYIDDPNYFLNNSYLKTEKSASNSSCEFTENWISEISAGHPTWSVGNISEIIGVNNISLVSASGDLGLYGASLFRSPNQTPYDVSPFSGVRTYGTFEAIAGKRFVQVTSGETSEGRSWNYLTGNSGVGLGSGIMYGGFIFGETPASFTVSLGGANLRFDGFSYEISMFIRESGSGDAVLTWENASGAYPLNAPVTWTWNTAEAEKLLTVGGTYYLDVRESYGDNFFLGSSPSAISFTIENDEIASGFTDPVPTAVGTLFLDGYGTGSAPEAARFYFIYNGTGSAPTNPTPGTSGETYLV